MQLDAIEGATGNQDARLVEITVTGGRRSRVSGEGGILGGNGC